MTEQQEKKEKGIFIQRYFLIEKKDQYLESFSLA